MANQLLQTHSFFKTTPLFGSSILYRNDTSPPKSWTKSRETTLTHIRQSNLCETENGGRKPNFRNERRVVCNGFLLLVDPWAPNVDSQSIASQLFAFSLFPYLGFLYFITKSNSVPRLTLFGFYFLLAFVGATIPAGIYAKVHYGTSLSNVDWLHGGAESLLTLTNLFIVLGLRDAIRKAENTNEKSSDVASEVKENEKSSI